MCSSPWTRPGGGPVKCGQCMECRLAYSREWAIRITHEAQMWDRNCFLTLTYDDLCLPPYGQLVKRDLQLFFKRLRKAGYKFRYVACGEYGEKRRRPHFHVALFGIDFSEDRIPYGLGVQNDQMYVSRACATVWSKSVFPLGHTIGSLSFESAAYIARYITKRVSGVGVSPLPLSFDSDSGEVVMPNPEFLLASKGIGKGWFHDYFFTDVFPHARVITSQGTPAPVPRYYKSLLRECGADLALDMSYRTSLNMEANLDSRVREDMPARRHSRDILAKARSGIVKRNI